MQTNPILVTLFLLLATMVQAQKAESLKRTVFTLPTIGVTDVRYYHDPATGHGYLAGLMPDTCIRFFDALTGQQTHQVAVPKFRGKYRYDTFFILSRDSIWLANARKKSFVLADSSGHILKTLTLPDSLGNPPTDYYLNLSTFAAEQALLFCTFFSQNTSFQLAGADLWIHPDSGVVNRSGAIPAGWAGRNPEQRFVLPDRRRVYAFSPTDTVWVTGPDGKDPQIRITSSPRYQPFPPFVMDPNENGYYDRSMEHSVTHAEMDQLLYDPWKQRYLRVVRWADTYHRNGGRVIGITEKKWSLQEYDLDFRPGRELIFPPGKYFPYRLIVGLEGVYVECVPDLSSRKIDFSTQKRTYALFDF